MSEPASSASTFRSRAEPPRAATPGSRAEPPRAATPGSRAEPPRAATHRARDDDRRPSTQLPGFAIVVAADQANGIGKDGKLPWRLPGEMAHFKRLTTAAPAGRRNAVIMGRKTFESIPPKFRPLSDRFNMVLSRDTSYRPEGAFVVQSLEQALSELTKLETVDSIFCIGGGELYAAALAHPRCERVYLTRVHATFDCDTKIADFSEGFRLVNQDGPHTEGEVSYTFETHKRQSLVTDA